jgi:hypothetical protein
METPLMANLYALVLDDDLRRTLFDLTGIVKLVDKSGNVVGHVLPADLPLEMLEGLRKCPYSEADLERFRQEKGGKTLEQIWKDLGQTA